MAVGPAFPPNNPVPDLKLGLLGGKPLKGLKDRIFSTVTGRRLSIFMDIDGILPGSLGDHAKLARSIGTL